MSLKAYGLLIAGIVLFVLPPIALAQTATSSDATTTPSITGPAAIEALVRAEFADAPVMIAIARCESKFRQFTDAGNVLNGGAGGMIGVFQINSAVHRTYAKSLGYDISTVEGNLGYARFLYSKEGSNPWVSSFPCWSSAVDNPEKNPANASALAISADASRLSANLSFGMVHAQVLTLQKLLNKMGYTISPDGPGSIGNETNKFGALTRVAVRRFQCAKNITCTGDEGSTGYGYVGARTRAALLQANPSDGSAPTAPASAKIDTSSQISLLEAQIAEFQKKIAELQAQIAALKAN